METMSCQDSAGSAWCHCSSSTGLGVGAGGGADDFLGLFGGDRHSSSDDLFELVWRGAGGGGVMEGQPSCKPLSSSRRPAAAVVPVPERLVPAPPSEAEMASWLVPIVSGGGDAGRRAWVDDDLDQMVQSPSGKESSDHHKLQEKRKALSSTTTGARTRSQHHAEAHSLTEKRRRRKIKEKLKTLQQLVPGLICHNSNQATTLDQTIRHIKSLQQHIQAMSSFRCEMKPTSVAVYPFVQPACWWQGGTMVQGYGSWAAVPGYNSSVLPPMFP